MTTRPTASPQRPLGDDLQCLLTYVFYPTWPQPVQISTPNGDANAVITVTVTNPTKASCNQIDIYLPVGSEPDALTANVPVVASSTPKWRMSLGVRVLGSEHGLGDGDFTRYSAHCLSSGDYGVNYPLAFSIAVTAVSSTAGEYKVGIVEFSHAAGEPEKFVQRSCSFTLRKEQPRFYLQNFIASVPSADKNVNVPVGEFKKSTPIRLSWEGNGSTYTVYTAGGVKPVYSGPSSSCTFEQGLEDTTTFILQASVTGADGGGGTGFETVYLYQSLTVKIVNPAIVATSLTVTDAQSQVSLLGGLSVAKSVQIQDVLTVDTISTHTGTLTAQGALTVSQRATLQGPVTLKDSLGVDKTSTLSGAVTLEDTLKVAKTSTFNGAVTLKDGLTVTNESQGIGITYNTLYTTGSNADQSIYLKPRGQGFVEAVGRLMISDLWATGGKYVYVRHGLHVNGELLYWWAEDNHWKQIQNRANNYAGSYDWSADETHTQVTRNVGQALDKVSKLRGVHYRLNAQGLQYATRDIESSISAGPEATPEEHERVWSAERNKRLETLSRDLVGMIAQEVEQAVPEVVRANAEGHKSIDYGQLSAVLVEAIKEQQVLIEELRTRLSALEASARSPSK